MKSVKLDLGESDLGESALARELVRILSDRGLPVETADPDSTPSRDCVIAKVCDELPKAATVYQLGSWTAERASSGTPPVIFLPPAKLVRGLADEYAASAALLRSCGAVVTSDPEVWVECLVLLAAHGTPKGPGVAMVAPPSSWLAAAAAARERRAERLGERYTALAGSPKPDAATEIVLTDASMLGAAAGDRSARSLVVPLAGGPLLAPSGPALVGLDSALAAAELCGQASQRIAAGSGPAPSPGEVDNFDAERFANQLQKLNDEAGDHECKVLLASYGVSITRQAVATTPSAAGRIAKRAGYPVEIKAWGPHQPSETEGAMVVRGIDTAAEVRRAFASVCARSKCDAVIVRETPRPGRELRVSIREHSALGLVVYVYQQGYSEAAAGMAPLRALDAVTLAHQVVASRTGDSAPDWQALADLLQSASHLVADNARMKGLELSRVLVGSAGRGALVVDAKATLSDRPPAR